MKNRAKWFVCMAVILAAALFLAFGVNAQEPVRPVAPQTKIIAPEVGPEVKKEAATPKLPDAVALEIRSAQFDLAHVVIEYQRTEKYLGQLKAAIDSQQSKVLLLTGGALKKAGIDAEKYELNAGTLAITARPEKKPTGKDAEKPKN